jgi:gamma-glutamylputrescine oxidase
MSYWLKDERKWSSYQDPRGLNVDEIHDVVIIGGGISGLSTAYHLSLLGIKCTVLEKEGLSAGATGCNGGFITPGTSEKYSESVTRLGLETTQALFDYTVQCTDAIKEFVKSRNIDCELRFNGVVSLASSSEELVALEDSFREMQEYRLPVEWWDPSTCLEQTKSQSFLGGIFKPFGGNLWAAKLVFGLAEAAVSSGLVNIQTHTAVTHVDRDSSCEEFIELETSRGSVRARRVVYATNAWTRQLLPNLWDVIVPVRNQVMIISPWPHDHMRPAVVI